MERTLLSVEAQGDGWLVSLDGETLDHYLDKREAIDAASVYADNRHEATGEPTGVVVPLCNGEVVVLGECG